MPSTGGTVYARRGPPTCGVFPGRGADRVLEVGDHLVAEVEVVVTGLVQQVPAAQVTFDHLLLGHRPRQEVHGEQREAHLTRGLGLEKR